MLNIFITFYANFNFFNFQKIFYFKYLLCFIISILNTDDFVIILIESEKDTFFKIFY